MKIYELKQGSDDWHIVRRGMITGTRLKDVFKANNLDLIDKLIAEKISDETDENYISKAMERGIELEPVALKEYESITGHIIDKVGFVVSSKYNYLGLSPDGLLKKQRRLSSCAPYSIIGESYTKAIEIKCPDTATHVRYIRQNSIPNEYKYQIYNYFLVCQDLESLDFISYDDRFQIKPLHIIKITREDIKDDLEKCEIELIKFWEKFEKYYSQVVFG